MVLGIIKDHISLQKVKVTNYKLQEIFSLWQNWKYEFFSYLSLGRLKVSLCHSSLSPFGFVAAVTVVILIGTVCFSIKFCKILALGRIMSFTENWNLIIQLFLLIAIMLLDFHWYDGQVILNNYSSYLQPLNYENKL